MRCALKAASVASPTRRSMNGSKSGTICESLATKECSYDAPACETAIGDPREKIQVEGWKSPYLVNFAPLAVCRSTLNPMNVSHLPFYSLVQSRKFQV